MNKEEAKQALKEGKKITHEYFEKHEFVMKHPTISGYIVFEDGVAQSESNFWNLRKDNYWDKGWELFN